MPIPGNLKKGILIAILSAFAAVLPITDVHADSEASLKPLNKYAKDARNSLIVFSLGFVPGAQIPIAAYKTTDLLREVADVAVDREQEKLGGETILISAQAGLLKGLHAQGVDLRSDPHAQAAIAQLKLLQIDVDPGEHGKYAQPLVDVSKNLGYAVTTVAATKAFSWSLGKAFSSLGLDKFFGKGVQKVLANNGPLASVLRSVGWKKLTARSIIAGSAAEKLIQKLTSVTAKDLSKEFLKEISESALGQMVKKELDSHPSQPVYHTRLLVARELVLAVPILPMPEVLPAVPKAAAVQRDPMQKTISTDDFIVHTSRDIYRPESNIPTTQPAAPQESVPTQREIQHDAERRHAWGCAGAGVKAGCSWNPGNANWGGEKNKTLYDK